MKTIFFVFFSLFLLSSGFFMFENAFALAPMLTQGQSYSNIYGEANLPMEYPLHTEEGKKCINEYRVLYKKIGTLDDWSQLIPLIPVDTVKYNLQFIYADYSYHALDVRYACDVKNDRMYGEWSEKYYISVEAYENYPSISSIMWTIHDNTEILFEWYDYYSGTTTSDVIQYDIIFYPSGSNGIVEPILFVENYNSTKFNLKNLEHDKMYTLNLIPYNVYGISQDNTPITVHISASADGLDDHLSLEPEETFFHDPICNCIVSSYDQLLQEPINGGGGSDNKWKTKPTFGLSHQTLVPLVDCGFSMDGKCYDIVDNWHTDFEMTTINVGDTHTFTLKGFFENQIKTMELSLGITQVGEFHNAEFSIPVFFDHDGNIEEYVLDADSNVVDSESLVISHEKTKCLDDSSDERCDAVTYEMRFLEPLQDHVSAMHGIDQKRKTQITYLNDGFDVTGESLNAMNTEKINSSVKYEGLITVTQESKYSDVWIAEDGRKFQKNSFGTFTEIDRTFGKKHSDPSTSVMTRMHYKFNDMVDAERDRAEMHLTKMCQQCMDKSFVEIDSIFAYEFPYVSEIKSDDLELQKAIIIEQQRAQQLFESIK